MTAPSAGPLRLGIVQIDAVPQAMSEYGRLWGPAEPLASSADFSEALSTSRFFAAAAGANARNILSRIHSIATIEMKQLLSEILAFVDEQDADVMVFPEYLVPVECMELLVGYSRQRVLVAGLGIIRNKDEAERVLDGAVSGWRSDDLVGRNVSVLVENERVHVVTKKYLSEREVAEPGQGPVLVEVTLRGRPVRLGVAVCMDYLRSGDAMLADGPDIVCIPACTPTVKPFLPDSPRDYVRLIANCGRYGGSTIVAPALRGSPFTDQMGVKAIGPGSAAIVMIEHDRFQQQPTGLVSTENRLILRSEIIDRAGPDEVAVGAARELAELRESRGWTTSSDLPEQIGRWLQHLKSAGPLRDCLEEFRNALALELDDEALYSVLSTHLPVASRLDEPVIRARQARFVVQRVGELIASRLETPPLGSFLDAYKALADTISGDTESHKQVEGKRWSFAINLGQYDSTSAVSTLPRQLNFLRAIGGLPPGSMAVTYRLQSSADPYAPDLRNSFDVIVTGDAAVVDAEQVESQLRSMLVASWPISGSDDREEPARAEYCIRVTPDLAGHAPSVRDDWSPVFDLIRTHDTPMTLDMRVVSLAPGRESAQPASDQDEALFNTLTSMPYMSVGDEAERRAAAYFNLLRDMSKAEERCLGMSLVLSSERPIPILLADTIRHEVFGTVPATIEFVELATAHADPVAFRPSELIRIFHPPYGHMQARGVSTKVNRNIPYQGAQLPKVGTKLGTARIAGPRLDRDVDVLLDETARVRHVYVIGRTGTGKTNFMKELCRQDIEAGRGLVVFDPHGDLVDYLSLHCKNRLAETVLLDFGQPGYVPAFNPLLVDIKDARSQVLHSADFLAVLESRYYNQYTGPVFNDMVRLALETMFEPGFPAARSLDLIEIMYRNREIRRLVAQSIEESSVLRDRWNVFDAMRDHEKAEHVVWMLSKFADLLPVGGRLRSALCTEAQSPLSIEDVVWNDGILLIKIPEWAVGAGASSFLGSLLLRRVQRAVFDYQSGTGKSPAERSTFTICIDEFQKFATAGIEELIAEARKFGCGLVLAHQNLEQLYAFSRYEGARSRELQDALLGNVGSVLAFRVGPQDADTLSDMLRTPARSFDQLPKFKALCRLTVDSDDTPCFTLAVEDASRNAGIKAAADRLHERMIEEGYWISTEAAAAAAERNVERFEHVLEVGRDGAARIANQERAEMVAKLGGEGDDFHQAVEDSELSAATETVLPDLLAGLISHYVTVPAAALQEMVDAVVAYFQGDAAEGSLVEAVLPLLPEATDAAAAAALADGLACIDEVLDGDEPQNLAELQQTELGWILAGFLGSRLGTAAHAEMVRRLIPTGLREPGLGAVLSDYPADIAATVRAAAECYLGAVAGSSLGRFLPGDAQLPVLGRQMAGPLDITEVESVPDGCTDLGAVYLTLLRDDVRASATVAGNGLFEQLQLESDGSALYLKLYAAPGGDLWPEITAVVAGRTEAQGTSVERLAGAYGAELRWTADGEDGGQERWAGIDGPGWVLQCVYAGAAAGDPARATALDEVLRGIVVKGGLGGYARGDVIRMRPPAAAVPAQAAPPAAQNGQPAAGEQAAAGTTDKRE
jgi:hypothetical protein